MTVEWTGNRGSGTSGYKDFSRDHVLVDGTKPPVPGSSDPAFRGDASRYNPEDLLVASISSCHMLWYLHLAAMAGIIVQSYVDRADGVMDENPDGSGQFSLVTLRPEVVLKAGSDTERDKARAEALHHDAHAKCFIARSVNFTINCEPVIRAG